MGNIIFFLDEKEKLFQDEDFVNELIKMIPNADENSEEIKVFIIHYFKKNIVI